MPKRVVAVLSVMYDWRSMTSDASYTELAPRSYTINPHNMSGKRLYKMIGPDAWLNVTNACPQLVSSASERGTPDAKWLAENLAEMRPFDLVLICGEVARQTYRLSSTIGARLIEMPHPAARTWTTQSLAFAARLIQEGSCDLSLTFKKKNGKTVLVARDIIPF